MNTKTPTPRAKRARKFARKPNTDHIVTDFSVTPPQFLCKHCGESSNILLPMLLDEFVVRGKAFVTLHQFCKPTTDSLQAHNADPVTALAEKLYIERMTRAAQTVEPEPEYADCVEDAAMSIGIAEFITIDE